MTWLARLLPFVGRAIHAIEVLRRDEQIAELTRQRDYWQARAERLIDGGLARAGAIDGPTMREAVSPPKAIAELVTAAMNVSEIDSTKRKGA